MTGAWLYVSSPRMSVAVSVEGPTVTAAPPIVRKFVGQPVANLLRWMARQGPLDVQAAFTCPRCRATSYSADAAAEGYCGACHDWTMP